MAFFNHVYFSAAFSLIVADINGQLSGFHPLKAIAFTARPVVDVLTFQKREKYKIPKAWYISVILDS